MSFYTMKCGCRIHREKDSYEHMCAEHEAEWKDKHERAAADHRDMDRAVLPSSEKGKDCEH